MPAVAVEVEVAAVAEAAAVAAGWESVKWNHLSFERTDS